MTEADAIIRALVVEDDQRLQTMLVSAFDDLDDLEVATASNSEEALALAKERAFDLVVTDIKMPGVDGLEALRRMKLQRPALESIVITGYSTEEESIRAIRLRVGEYLRKPFRLDDLLDAVARAVNRVREHRARQKQEKEKSQATFWALSALLKTHPQTAELLKKAPLAPRLAEAVGYNRQVGENVQMAVLILGYEQLAAPPEDFRTDLTESLLDIVEGRNESLQELVQAVLDWPNGEGQMAELLDELESQAPEGQRGREALLAAAYLGEVAGDGQAALETYEELLEKESRPHQRVEALLGVARIYAARGDLEKGRETVSKAVFINDHLPPELKAHSMIEGGLILGRLGYQEARPLLKKALACSLPDSTDQSRARLALSLLGEGSQLWIDQALTRLLTPSHLDLLLDAAWWLMPALLWRRESGLETRALRRLVRELPGQVYALLESTSLPETAQVRLATLLLETRPRGVDSLLKQLNRKTSFTSVRELIEQAETDSESHTPSMIRFFSLGGFEVFRGEQRLGSSELGGKKRFFLLAYLASSERPLSPDETVEEFWPEQGQKGHKLLGQSLSVLRKVLRGDEGSEVNYIVKDSSGLSLSPDQPVWHDYLELVKHLQAVEHLQPDQPWRQSAEHVEQITRLYRGPYMNGCYMEWALTKRSSLEQRVVSCLLKMANLAAGQNLTQQTLYCAERVLELDPCNQEAALQAMEALLSQGRGEAALKIFKSCEKALKSELNLEPSIDLLRAQQKVLLLS